MNESENLLILSLSQAGFLPEELNIKSLLQLNNDLFGNIIVKIGKKLKSIKGVELLIPEQYAKEISSKYKDAQILVDFLKKIGYKSELNINNILFPSQRDMQRILEFLIEQITNNDANTMEISQNFSEKNFIKMKVSQKLLNWTKEAWVLPEIEQESRRIEPDFKTFDKKLIKYDNSKIQGYKKKIKDINLSPNIKSISTIKSKALIENDDLKIISEDDYKVLDSILNIEESNNYLYKKIQKAVKAHVPEKNSSQQFIDYINKRSEIMDSINNNYLENNFTNNVNILKSKNMNIKLGSLLKSHLDKTDIKKSVQNEKKYDNVIAFSEKEGSAVSLVEEKANPAVEGIESGTNNSSDKHQIYQRKIDQIISNIEKEKEDIVREIKEKSSILQNIILTIEEKSENFRDLTKRKEESEQILSEITIKNQNLLKQIEDKLETFEQIQKMNRAEIKEDDILKEVETLEKKFDIMISNWEEYTSQAKSKIDELKNNLETKKKEYNFKYEKVNLLKKEIEDISSRISVKEQLSSFLNEEYLKIPVDINRNKFINKITELTQNINKEKNNIIVYLTDIKNIENQINVVNESIKKVDNEFEDKLFQDAKKDATSKELYALFIKIRDGYNLIQKNIIDLNSSKTKMKELESKVDDYQMKLKSYDINQLSEQVEILRKENSMKFRK